MFIGMLRDARDHVLLAHLSDLERQAQSIQASSRRYLGLAAFDDAVDEVLEL